MHTPLFFMKKINKFPAFTLVELIVVITILVVLGTISFISLISFNKAARESARINDLNTIAKALEFFYTEEGYYPSPTDAFDITFSWSVAWNQWTFGVETQRTTQRVSQVPRDPLTGNEYAYSTTNTKQEFEIWAISESILSSNFGITPQANAASIYFASVKWNYNRQIITVQQTDKIYVLWVPTIITSEINTVTVQDIIANGTFAYRNGQNLPWSYSWQLQGEQTIGDSSTAFLWWALTDTISPVIYEGTIDQLSSDFEKQIFTDNLMSYYQNSNLDDSNMPWSKILSMPENEGLEYTVSLIRSSTWWLPGKQIITNASIDYSSCYDSANVNSIGNIWPCNWLLIIDEPTLKSVAGPVVWGDSSFQITWPDANIYTFADSEYNIFTGKAVDVASLFESTSFNGDISYWDVSNVSTIGRMFHGNNDFNQDIGAWDVSSVTDMTWMFQNTNDFNQDIGAWNVSNVVSMESMFRDARVFNQNIGAWDVSDVISMNSMFRDARDFNQDISLWDTSKIINMQFIFHRALNFDQDIGSWDVGQTENMRSIFQTTPLFNQDLTLWDITSVTSTVNFDDDATVWTPWNKPCFWNSVDTNADGAINCLD